MTHTPTATRRRNHRQAGQAQDEELLPEVVAAVRAAGATLAGRFAADARPASSQTLLAAIESNDSAALSVLRPALERARAGVGWVDDEEETGPLPAGEWWVVDPVEGNVNHIHGLTDWGVTATLVRDNTPVLAVVHLPVTGTTYTALRDVGAYQDGTRLHVSAKTELAAALVGTGQAMPGEDPRTYQRIGSAVTAMLQAALVTRVSVPATLQLIEVAAGRMDAFWQYSAVRTGLLAGALLVTEAGATVTDTHGNPWNPTSQDVLAVSPGLHPAAVLAATGATGRLLVQQALSRGHTVLALARDPARIDTSASPHFTAVAADVTDRDSVVRAVTDVDVDVVVSGLGVAKGARPGTLLAGAQALTAAQAQRPTLGIVWLGAFGTGQSAGPAGPLVRALLVVALGAERSDKANADAVALAAGASVLHPGPLTNKPLSPTRSTVALADLPRRLFPRTVARATVAAAMLDEAEHPRHRGHIVVPLT